MFRLVVDHCEASQVTEDIEDSVTNRSMCEAIAEAPGDSVLLKTIAPLQLGGRSVNSAFPGDLWGSYTGCMKNLWQNGKVLAHKYSVQCCKSIIPIIK